MQLVYIASRSLNRPFSPFYVSRRLLNTFVDLRAQQRFNELSKVPDIRILHWDDEYLVIDKPFDLRIDGDTERHTVQSALYHHYPTLPKPLRHIHQLDHATSGCYCIALTAPAAAVGCIAFSKRRVHKTYLAMLRGWMAEDRYVVEQPIAEVASNRFRMCIGSEDKPGKNAKTEIEVYRRGFFDPLSFMSTPPSLINSSETSPAVPNLSISLSRSIPVTLVRLNPITGRRHQLRLHSQYLNHPIVGDWHYEKEIMDYTDTFRMMLHAQRIVIPLDGGCGKKQRRRNKELKIEKLEGKVLDVGTEDPFIGLVTVDKR
ncbi:hypothetical protein G9A89_009798 [Geosiphon pyriformis]|nr:hypothetical protein G9A89_009798 [Geosiphon pyriformis]